MLLDALLSQSIDILGGDGLLSLLSLAVDVDGGGERGRARRLCLHHQRVVQGGVRTLRAPCTLSDHTRSHLRHNLETLPNIIETLDLIRFICLLLLIDICCQLPCLWLPRVPAASMHLLIRRDVLIIFKVNQIVIS